jgi:predicted nucleic acid-binding Zn ribbon protein
MPTYLYSCEHCGQEIEQVQRITEDALTEIAHKVVGTEVLCMGPVKRLIAGRVTFGFKGGAPSPKTYV